EHEEDEEVRRDEALDRLLRVEADDRRRRGVERGDVLLARWHERGRGDRGDPREEDDERWKDGHAHQEPVPERLAPLAHAHRAHDRLPRCSGRERAHVPSTTRRYTSSSEPLPSLTYATSAPSPTTARMTRGFTRSGSAPFAMIVP